MPAPANPTETTELAATPEERGLVAFLQRHNPFAHVGQAAAVVGLIGGVVGLLFVFKPGWKPDPPPDIGTLEVSDVRVRQPVTFERYLERLRLAPGDLTEQFLRRKGLLVEFDYEAEGFRGERLPIQWELVEAETHNRVKGDDAVAIAPSTNKEAAKWFVWVESPKARKTYYVTVTIYQPRKGEVEVPLADFDTPAFRGAGPA